MKFGHVQWHQVCRPTVDTWGSANRNDSLVVQTMNGIDAMFGERHGSGVMKIVGLLPVNKRL